MPSRHRLAALAGGLVLSAAGLAPAAAQNPFSFLFGSAPEPQNAAPARTTAPVKAAAQSTGPAAAPATAARPPKRPAPRPDEAATSQSGPARAVPPSAVGPAAGAPLVLASSNAAGKPLAEPQQIVERANAYFNAIGSLVGDFVQIGGDGRRLTGTLYLQRPGKIRFEYDAPATLEVIADGSSVAVRDRKLATQDLYSIGQTPLKFLLRDRIELGRDLKITDVAAENDGVRVSVEDRSTLGGTSKITLYFDREVANLTRWRILDPQGFQTTVSLANVERNKRIEQSLFTIDYQRVLNDR